MWLPGSPSCRRLAKIRSRAVPETTPSWPCSDTACAKRQFDTPAPIPPCMIFGRLPMESLISYPRGSDCKTFVLSQILCRKCLSNSRDLWTYRVTPQGSREKQESDCAWESPGDDLTSSERS